MHSRENTPGPIDDQDGVEDGIVSEHGPLLENLSHFRLLTHEAWTQNSQSTQGSSDDEARGYFESLQRLFGADPRRYRIIVHNQVLGLFQYFLNPSLLKGEATNIQLNFRMKGCLVQECPRNVLVRVCPKRVA
jgi:hypothetical protein